MHGIACICGKNIKSGKYGILGGIISKIGYNILLSYYSGKDVAFVGATSFFLFSGYTKSSKKYRSDTPKLEKNTDRYT